MSRKSRDRGQDGGRMKAAMTERELLGTIEGLVWQFVGGRGQAPIRYTL